jgi:transmembrane sensor
MEIFEDDDVEQLLNDPRFKQWVLEPDEELETYWQDWLRQFPGKHEKLTLAREALESILGEILPLSEALASQNIERIMNKVNSSSVTWSRIASIAASIVLLMGAVFFVQSRLSQTVALDKNLGIQHPEPSTNEWINSGKDARLVILPEGSAVLLQPSSRITYQISDSLRHVYLEGEAFFEISKDALTPFCVQTRTLTSRVLGTSFRVRDFENQTPLVRVNTGKVAVSLNTEIGSGSTGEAIVLSPTQIATYHGEELTVLSPLENIIGAPLELFPIEKKEHVYKRAALPDVFQGLEEAYAITIHYDRKLLQNCSLTARLGDEPLVEKLRMICLGSNLSLTQTTPNTFTISGSGCR